MTAIYVITKFLALPGTLLKAFNEQVMCRIFKCPVEDTRYLRTDEACGHVEHEFLDTGAKSFFYCFFPSLMSFLFGVVFSVPVLFQLIFLGVYNTIYPYIFLWLAVCMFSNMFPLVEDAMMMREKVYGKDGMSLLARILFAPGFAVMYVGAKLEAVGATFFLDIALALAFALL